MTWYKNDNDTYFEDESKVEDGEHAAILVKFSNLPRLNVQGKHHVRISRIVPFAQFTFAPGRRRRITYELVQVLTFDHSDC